MLMKYLLARQRKRLCRGDGDDEECPDTELFYAHHPPPGADFTVYDDTPEWVDTGLVDQYGEPILVGTDREPIGYLWSEL